MTDRGKEQPFAARRKIPAVEWTAKKKKKKEEEEEERKEEEAGRKAKEGRSDLIDQREK